jgi:hypothetical protein
MNSPYDLHYWSTQYRQERLREARTKQLQGRLRECRKARSGRGFVSLALANLLSPVRGA